jgi:hypothetical protein
MNKTFVEYYRCPEEFAGCFLDGEPSGHLGHFRFGPDAICYGSISKGAVHPSPDGELHDALKDAVVERGGVSLSFDPDQVVNNLRFERYCSSSARHSLLSGGLAPEAQASWLAFDSVSALAGGSNSRAGARDDAPSLPAGPRW